MKGTLVDTAPSGPRDLRPVTVLLVVCSVLLTAGCVAMGLHTVFAADRCPPVGVATHLDRTPMPASLPVAVTVDELITCGGALDRSRHDYADNVIVFATYVGRR